MSETTNQISRREILKRGAFVGGAVVWATPVVQTLGMGRAFAASPSDTCVPSWATAVVLSGTSQGLQRNGLAVADARSNPNNALYSPGTPPTDPTEEDFFSLGFGRPPQDGGLPAIGGGSLVVQLGTPYFSGKDGELVVIETTRGTYPLEQADVYVGGSATGPWTWIGLAKNTDAPSLEKPLNGIGGLPAIITHVLLHDQTDPALFPIPNIENEIADAFDVRAVGIGCPGVPSPK